MADAKLDLFKLHKDQYKAKAKPHFLTVPEIPYLTIEGSGNPNSKQFEQKVGAMYGAAYTMKFSSKIEQGRDYVVAKLEGLWWGVGLTDNPTPEEYDKFEWKLLIRLPDFITEADLAAAKEALEAKGKGDGFLGELGMEIYEEGYCAQIMHIGPYNEEAPTIQALHKFIEDEGYELTGLHHEIYLSDPRRTAPEKMKTIIRQPAKKA
jgi:hypothetical protein